MNICFLKIILKYLLTHDNFYIYRLAKVIVLVLMLSGSRKRSVQTVAYLNCPKCYPKPNIKIETGSALHAG